MRKKPSTSKLCNTLQFLQSGRKVDDHQTNTVLPTIKRFVWFDILLLPSAPSDSIHFRLARTYLWYRRAAVSGSRFAVRDCHV